jgi:transcriptional regulator
MYIPSHFEEPDLGVLHALMQSHPLGAWVTTTDEGLLVNHIPFLLDPSRGPFGTLYGHVARANPVWSAFSRQTESVVIFQGPQGYITPSWYPSKQAHGKVVPTWNYAVVHAHGMPRVIDDADWLLRHVTAATERHEATHGSTWKVSDAPADYIDGMLKAIVGIEIPVARLFGKWKTSQNRPQADQLGVIAGLMERGDTGSQAMAAMVDRHTADSDG